MKHVFGFHLFFNLILHSWILRLIIIDFFLSPLPVSDADLVATSSVVRPPLFQATHRFCQRVLSPSSGSSRNFSNSSSRSENIGKRAGERKKMSKSRKPLKVISYEITPRGEKIIILHRSSEATVQFLSSMCTRVCWGYYFCLRVYRFSPSVIYYTPMNTNHLR